MNGLLLTSEASIDGATQARRAHLVAQLAQLPSEAFSRLQYLQVQVGCFNRCKFCSQEAGVEIWQISASGLADLAAAIVAIKRQRGIQLGRDRSVHRPGVLFPYFDNDPASYPYLEQLVRICVDDLRVKLRLSTVGYSRHHSSVVLAHRRIVEVWADAIEGIRFSLTPYAIGYRRNRDEYLADLAAALATWKPYVDRVGPSATTAAVELRFAPLVHAVEEPLFDAIVDGHHILACPPHLLVSINATNRRPTITRIKGMKGREPTFTQPGEMYLHVVSDELLTNANFVRIADLALSGLLLGAHRVRLANVYTWLNSDGPYYAIDPQFTIHGRYRALHLYQKTNRRQRSGYTDATRWFLNALITHKATCGVDRRAAFPNATPADVRAVLDRMAAKAGQISATDARATMHITRHVLPLVEAHRTVLEDAGYPPSAFFDRRFTIDTGQIVNQGNAKSLFLGLAATDDEPMTPQEERGYGAVSLSSVRGTVWRIAPTPVGKGPPSRIGGKNYPQSKPSLVVEELDPLHLRPFDKDSGRSLRRFVLDGVETEKLRLTDAAALHSYPGSYQ